MCEGSSSSLSAEESVPQPLQVTGEKLYIVVVKNGPMGSPEVREFTDLKEGLYTFHQYLEKQRRGEFLGRVWAFKGYIIDYTVPISTYKLRIGNNELRMSGEDPDEYVGKTGGILR